MSHGLETDPSRQHEVLARSENTKYLPSGFKCNLAHLQSYDLNVMDPSVTHSVGMGKSKPLTGVALLRRQHSIDGHPALSISGPDLSYCPRLLLLLDNERLRLDCGRLLQDDRRMRKGITR